MLIDYLRREMRQHADDDGTPSGGSTAEPTPAPTPAPQSGDDDFDKERAMATIQKLRGFEKDAKAKLARLAELEQQAAERDQADLTAAQKAEKRAADLEAKYNEAQASLKRAMLKDAARAAADALALPFAPGALDDALSLGLLGDLEVDEDGKVRGINEALKQLQKARPHYFTLPRTPASDAAARGGKSDNNEALQRNASRWGIRLPSE